MADVDSSAPGRADALASLRSIAGPSLASSSELSTDGATLTLRLPSGTVSFDAAARHTATFGDKACSYSLGSLYLQIVNPDQSLLQYRQACKKHGVSDGVKATDKAAVVSFFLGGGEGVGEAKKAGDGAEADEKEGIRDRDREEPSERRKDDEGGSRRSDDRDRHRDRDRDRDDRRRREKEKQHRDRDRDRDRHRDDKERRHSSDRHRKDRDHHHRHRDDKDRRHSSDRHGHHHKDKHGHHKDKHDRDRDRHGHHHHHKHRDKHDKHHHRHRHDRDRDDDRDGKGGKSKKSSKAPITNEQLMEHLDTVVGKRTQPAAAGRKAADEAGAGPEGGGAPPKEGGEAAAPASAEAKDSEEKRAVTPGPDDGGGGGGSGAAADGGDEEEDEAALLARCLSSRGFEVRNLKAEIEADRPAVERIAAAEIPVGNSASVLRCGGGGGGGGSAGGGGDNGKKDFGRVLDLYNEVLKAEERAKKGGGTPGPGGAKRLAPPPPGGDPKRARQASSGSGAGGEPARAAGKPIIVVPNAMTSPITMVNAHQFFQDRLFVPRDVALRQSGRKRPPSLSVRRRVAPRLGGGEVEYEIVDNPATRLQRSADWDRVVAVLAQGASWQFKGWRSSNPVDIFSRSFGFYIGMEGAPVPAEVKGWNVKIGTLNRDKRGLDSVTSAGFWNGLDEWMSVHKPQYLPSAD